MNAKRVSIVKLMNIYPINAIICCMFVVMIGCLQLFIAKRGSSEADLADEVWIDCPILHQVAPVMMRGHDKINTSNCI